MKENLLNKKMIFAVLLLLVSGSCPLFAAKSTTGKFDGKSVPQGVVSEAPGGANAEKLLYTLNETLQENRKIRQSMRDLQEAFEKVTLDKSDMAEQMKKVESLAIQRNKEAGQQIDELSAQLESSKKEMERLQADNKVSVEQKLEVEKKLEAINAENAKMQQLLKSSILASERDRIVADMEKNEKTVKEAMAQVSSLDGENIELREQLIQSYFNLGNMFYDLGRYQDAEAQYLNVLKWNPDHAWAHHNLAIIYDFHLHRLPQAREHYQKYMHLKLPSEEAQEARMRLWDLVQLSKVTPEQPLKQDFDKYEKMPRA